MQKIVCCRTRKRFKHIYGLQLQSMFFQFLHPLEAAVDVRSLLLQKTNGTVKSTYCAKPDPCAPPDRPSATSSHSALESVSREEGRRVDVAVVAPPVPH